MAIQRGVALFHEKSEFDKKCTFCQLGHGFTLLPLFQKVLAFPQFLRYDDEMEVIYHAWIEYDILKFSRRWDEQFGF